MKGRTHHEGVSDRRLCDVDSGLADKEGIVRQSKEADRAVRSASMHDKSLQHSPKIEGYVLGLYDQNGIAIPRTLPPLSLLDWVRKNHDPLRRKQRKRTGIAPNPSLNP